MRLNLTAALGVTLSILACSDRTPTAPTTVAPGSPPSIRISGQIIDYATGRSVAGTTVMWRAPSGSQLDFSSINSVSDASGHFEVDLPVKDGYTPLTDVVVFESPLSSGAVRIPVKHFETDVLVNGGPCAARYGYVFDSITRQPIAGARVQRAGTATTDANGYYRIDIGCEPHDAFYWGIGTTTISVSHPAYTGTFALDGRREPTSFSGIRRVDFALQPLGQ